MDAAGSKPSGEVMAKVGSRERAMAGAKQPRLGGGSEERESRLRQQG